MKKIMYLIHVDWNWIKQRPQFIAELLSEDYFVMVVYQYHYSRSIMQKRKYNLNKNLFLKPIYLFPLIGRSNIGMKINQFIKKIIVSHLISKENPDIIYTTFPDQVELISKKFSGKVLYDCMDNHPAFVNMKIAEIIYKQEKKLLDRADKILFSSQRLREMVTERYNIENQNKFYLVRNGYSGEIHNTLEEPNKDNRIFRITYFGTISSWFHFTLLKKSLKQFDNIEYNIIGPCENRINKNEERIHFLGIVEHEDLYNAIKNSDCLIMPFKVNEIVEAVDPVKLYEYINFNKNIICVYYNEIRRFEPFVYFYNDYDEFQVILNKLLINNKLKYSSGERKNFLENNNWNARVKDIIQLINDFYENK